jgi:hypothetical protein
MSGITVVVTGGRDYDDRATLYRELDAFRKLRPIWLLVQGGQKGADTLAKEWAIERGVTYQTVNANWDRYGRAAGPIRNRAMLEAHKPDYVVAFPGHDGTANCVRQARARGIPVLEVALPPASARGGR